MGTSRGGESSAAIGRRHPPAYFVVSIVIIGLVALAAGVAAFLQPAFPRRIVMATGDAGGAYAEYGERYRQLFAQNGVRLEVQHSSGSVANLAMLRDRKAGVEVALVQNGLTSAQRSPDLVSLGTVSVEPVWIFYRPRRASLSHLAELRGRRVSIGPAGSGMRSLALALLARNGIDERNTRLLPLAAEAAAARLVAGDIDAALIVASLDAPAVQTLLASPAVRLLPMRRADAYVGLYPYLTKVTLPAGFIDLMHDRPPSDVAMVAVKTSLVVRRDLPAAVQYLLLEAGRRIFSGPGLLQRAGEFPAGEATDLPLSDTAREFYRSGRPFLQRYLPLWLAILLAQLAITLLPVAAVAYPLLRVIPAAYGWGMRRRIYVLYGELKQLELSLEGADRQQETASLAALSGLQYRASHLRVPASYTRLLYAVRRDIELVRARLKPAPAEGELYTVSRLASPELRRDPAMRAASSNPSPSGNVLAAPENRGPSS